MSSRSGRSLAPPARKAQQPRKVKPGRHRPAPPQPDHPWRQAYAEMRIRSAPRDWQGAFVEASAYASP